MSAHVLSPRSGENAFKERLQHYGQFLVRIGLSPDLACSLVERMAKRMVAEAAKAVGPRIPRRPFDHLKGDGSLN